MASNYYKRVFKNHSYSYAEILAQIQALKNQFEHVKYRYDYKTKEFSIFMKLTPTDNSMVYTVEILCTVGRTKVEVFVRNPDIDKMADGKKIPHRYSNKSLCLFYPYYEEWKYSEKWADTIVPWTCLWLYYFELWVATGEWLGGGKH